MNTVPQMNKIENSTLEMSTTNLSLGIDNMTKNGAETMNYGPTNYCLRLLGTNNTFTKSRNLPHFVA